MHMFMLVIFVFYVINNFKNKKLTSQLDWLELARTFYEPINKKNQPSWLVKDLAQPNSAWL